MMDRPPRPPRLVSTILLAAVAAATAGAVISDAFWRSFLLVLIVLTAGWRLRATLRDAVSRVVADLRARTGALADAELDDRGRGILAPAIDAINRMLRTHAQELDAVQNQLSEQQAVLSSMSNGLIALDLDQRLLSLNRAAERMLGLYREPVRGRLVQEVTRQPGLHAFINDAMDRASSTTGEFELEGDSPVRILAASEPLKDADDRPRGMLILLTDITHIRRLETLRSDFAANVSHELRTPITNIKGYIETLLDVGLNDEAQSRHFLEIVRTNTDRLGSIIEDLLALARLEQPEAGKALNPIEAPVHKIVESAAAQLEDEARDRRIRISIDVPPSLTVEANPHLIEQAVTNLLSNALRYCPAGTPVGVSAREIDGWVEIAVRDEGPGIASQHLSRIFERFYRVDRARSREQGGTGLGLAIVKHIALVHGGRIEVDSKVGRGSTFRLILPVTLPS